MPTDISTYTLWSGYATIFFLIVAIVAFIFKWVFRFRLVGVTSFMAVLTAGFFALNLGLFKHVEIPGAVRYSLVYDSGANQAVIAIAPEAIEESAIEPTLRQAASDLFSFGRASVDGDDKLTLRLRTMLHPQPGVSVPLYLGEIKRSLYNRDEEQAAQVKIFSQNIAKLPDRG
jgi:Protein of function (DUF2518)